MLDDTNENKVNDNCNIDESTIYRITDEAVINSCSTWRCLCVPAEAKGLLLTL